MELTGRRSKGRKGGDLEYLAYGKDRMSDFRRHKLGLLRLSRKDQNNLAVSYEQSLNASKSQKKKQDLSMIPEWVVTLEEIQNINKDINNQVEDIEQLMIDRERHAFELPNKSQMLVSDKRLLSKISKTQQGIRKKEKILRDFKEEAGYVGGTEKTIIDNIYSKYSFANNENERTFRQMEKHLQDIQGSYQLFKEKSYTKDDAVDQREREVDSLCRNMKEINKLFKQVQDVVYEQGTMVDRIDYNIANADRNVENANKQLEEIYDRYRGAAFKCQYILLAWIYVCLLYIVWKWS